VASGSLAGFIFFHSLAPASNDHVSSRCVAASSSPSLILISAMITRLIES